MAVLAALIATAPSGVAVAPSVMSPLLPMRAQQHHSIAEQLAHQAHLVNRAKRYLAYFQAYTSTFAEVQVLRSMYQQAVSQASIVGLCVGTRRIASRRQ